MRYLDPKNDITFKRVFGEHPNLLRSFLNSIMPFDDGVWIDELEYLPLELLPESILQKQTIVDVRCIDNHKRQFIVEMQMIFTQAFFSRVLFNAAKIFSRQLSRGEKYLKLSPVYSLNIVNDDMGFQSPGYFHHYQILDVQFPQRKLNGIEYVFIEIPKFKAANLTEKKIGVLWLKYLAMIENKKYPIPEEMMQVPEIAKAIQLLEESSYTVEELEKYDKYWDVVRTQASMLHDAEAKGLETGKQIGKEIGMEIGVENTTVNVIVRCYNQGLSLSLMEAISGRSQDEILSVLESEVPNFDRQSFLKV